MEKVKLYDEVKILATNEKAIIVYISDKEVDDCYILEIIDKNEMPEWYRREEFEKL